MILLDLNNAWPLFTDLPPELLINILSRLDVVDIVVLVLGKLSDKSGGNGRVLVETSMGHDGLPTWKYPECKRKRREAIKDAADRILDMTHNRGGNNVVSD